MEKRNRFTWFLYACILCLCFSVVTASLTRLMGLPVQFYFLLTAAVVAAALLAVYLPARLIAAKWRPDTGWMYEGKKGVFSSFFLPAALTALLICIRLFCAAPAGGAVETQACYGQALSGDLFFSPFLGDLYAFLLWAGLRIFSKEWAVSGINLALQAAGLLLFYEGIRKLNGAFCGMIAAFAVIFLPPFSDSAVAAEPQSLLFLFASLMIWLCGLFASKGGKKRGIRAFFLVFVSVLCGMEILIAPLLSAVFFFWLAVIFCCLRSNRMRGIGMAAALCGALCGFCFLLLIGALARGERGTLAGQVAILLQSWLAPDAVLGTDAVLHSPSIQDYWMTLAVFVPAMFALFTPDANGRRGSDYFPAWVILLGAAAFWETVSKAPLQEQGLRFACLGVFAGMGIRNMFFVLPGMQSAEEKGVEKREPEEFVRRNPPLSRPAPGEYLENPLPVPKRHKKREMDYGFEPQQDQMYYEIPVADNDDFDLKE